MPAKPNDDEIGIDLEKSVLPKIHVFGVPMDLGQERRGVDMGPSAIRYAELHDTLISLGYTVRDHGNIRVPNAEEIRSRGRRSAGSYPRQGNSVFHLNAVAEVCTEIRDKVSKTVPEDDITICLGGDHSIALGTITATCMTTPRGILWVDAHADFNTPDTSPSGNAHGMPLAALFGEGAPEMTAISAGHELTPSQIVMIGLRSVDPSERLRLRNSGITVFTMADIDEHGMAAIARQTIDRLSVWGSIHVSLDMDSIDPESAPGVGTPVRGGLTTREGHLLMELLAESGLVRSLDLVEVNPIVDRQNQTAELAVELTASLFGQRTL